ncbi:MAG: DUF4924 family protein [Dysgonomonas sp.]
MLIAKQKREENIAEYLLYMWQIEDIIRANRLDMDSIEKNIISKFDQPESVKSELRDWYSDLIEMMRSENVIDKGHLQINNNVIINLTDLHKRLLSDPKQNEYIASYYKTLPFIVELRAKGAEKDKSEIETCFDALYGFLLLKIQRKEISGETQSAIAQISSFLRVLSEKYKLDKQGLLETE